MVPRHPGDGIAADERFPTLTAGAEKKEANLKN
jgi:hypothetical protein